MPGKHVHFAPDISVHTPASPTYSFSSLPTLSDSDGPLTPSSLIHSGSPYSCSPLPHVGVTLNQRLSSPAVYGNGNININNNTSLLSFDLTLDPSETAIARLPAAVLLEPATYPPLPHMIIAHKRLPWQIRLGSSDGPHATPYVTVRDVLHGIQRFLRCGATKTEYERIPSEQARSGVSNAYVRRCKAAYDFEAERVAGLKRVDFLAGNTRFVGLSGTSRGPEVWELHTTVGV
ncbi:hypothetical protein AX17_007153 [Amanita inopinata Kibby_2008]|nr:hypothetical protein AX17_007153 [Amanita inopinata Kibby_2008]